jgi:hypothetical protein
LKLPGVQVVPPSGIEHASGWSPACALNAGASFPASFTPVPLPELDPLPDDPASCLWLPLPELLPVPVPFPLSVFPLSTVAVELELEQWTNVMPAANAKGEA